MRWEDVLVEMPDMQMEIPIFIDLTYFPDPSWEALGAKCRYMSTFIAQCMRPDYIQVINQNITG